jgi:hypothetical protein
MDTAHWKGATARQRGTKCRALPQGCDHDMVPRARGRGGGAS